MTPPRPIPALERVPPPHSMPGYIVCEPLLRNEDGGRGVQDAIVVEMAWADDVPEVPFTVGARVSFLTGVAFTVEIDGYLLIPFGAVVAWTDGGAGR